MLKKGFYNLRGYEPAITSMDSIIKTFFYDNPFSVATINQEKGKHNFSTRHWQEIIKDGKAILAYDVHGINPENLKVVKTVEDGTYYITIEGKTENNILDCDMEVKTRWAIPYKQFKKPTKKIENGILYVFVEQDIVKEEIEEI